MAKKRKKRSGYAQRDVSIITKPYRLLRSKTAMDDRRRWKPDLSEGFLLDDGRYAEYEIRRDDPGVGGDRTRGRIAFVNPTRVRVCQKRKARREALFKARKIGKGRKIRGKRRMRLDSMIKC